MKQENADRGEGIPVESVPLPEDFQVIPPNLVGQEGRALTILRPSGKAKIGDTVYSVETEGEFVPQGTPVRVVQVRGNRITVKAI